MRSIGIYLHIPFCKRRCGYCSFVSTTNAELQREYVKALKREITRWAGKACDCVADTLYIGGGTPTCLYAGGLAEIYGAIADSFKLRLAEFTVECNPESLDGKIGELKDIGANRLSIGVQSLNDTVLERIGRLHDGKTALNALNTAHRVTDNVSADIILGLPLDSAESVTKTVKGVGEYCKHVSAYALSVERGTALYSDGCRINGDYERELYDRTVAELNGLKLERYEVSNFARSGYESKHNLKYWRREEYVGLGAAAHSFFDGFRYAGSSDISEYIKGAEPTVKKVAQSEAENEYIMLALRTREGLDVNEYEKLFNKSFYIGREKALLKLKPCLEINEDRVAIRSDYVYVGNAVTVELMSE